MTGIRDAIMDSLPLVIFTRHDGQKVIGPDACQKRYVVGIPTTIRKYHYQVEDVKELPRVIKEAFHIATTGRPGSVVVEFTKNIAESISDVNYDPPLDLPGYQPTTGANPLQIVKLLDALSNSKKPVI